MTEREKVIAAFICSNDALPDKRCEKCPFGYEYIDQVGDDYIIDCLREKMLIDAIDMLRAQEPIAPNHVEDGNNENCGIVNHWLMCGKCGSCIDPGDKYCRECGQAVKWDG